MLTLMFESLSNLFMIPLNSRPLHQVNEHAEREEGYEAGVKWCQRLSHTWGVQACNTGRKYVLTAQSHLFYGLSIRDGFDTFDAVSDLP